MLKKLYSIVIALAIALPSLAQTGSGTLKGVVTDAETGEPIPFAAVVAKIGDRQVAGTATDFDGNYTIKPLAPDNYDVYVSVVGYNVKVVTGVVINSDKITFQSVAVSAGIDLEAVDIVSYSVPLIDKDAGSSGGTVTSEDISKMPLRSATSVASTVAGVDTDVNGQTSIRGARPENTYYYIDGVKVIGTSSLPKSAIQEVSVITGGVPASYGDVTGGIINITTKGAASSFYGGIEALSSGWKNGEEGAGLDKFAYNLVEGNVSGPLLFKKDSTGRKERSLLGFFVAGNYRNEMDARPTFGLMKMNDDVRNEILANPLRISQNGNGAQYNAEFLTMDDFHSVATAQNVNQQEINISGKIDISPSEMIDVSLGVQYNWQKGNNFGTSSRVLPVRYLANSENNSLSKDEMIRTYVRFVQRFQNSEGQGGVKNAFYQVLVDFTNDNGTVGDANFDDQFFDYGYIGSYTTYFENNYTFDPNRQAYLGSGWKDTSVVFVPSDLNPELAAITSQYYDFFGADNVGTNGDGPTSSLTAIQEGNGLLNGENPQVIYGLWESPGAKSDFYRVYSNDQFRVSAMGSADIGEHALQLGVEFEQRNQSRFAVGDRGNRGPVELWTLARQQTNTQLQNVDKSDSTVTFPNGTYAYITYPRLVDLPSQSTFDRNLRISLGMNPNGDEIIDVDALDPDQLSLSLFSPDELLASGQNYVSYYGYTYDGKKSNDIYTYNDFYTQIDSAGNFTRNVGAFRPSYVAGYIMDKFAFNDIIFNVGVRVDRYDANQGVLIDPYVLGQTYKAGDVTELNGSEVSHPANIGDNYVVYVDNIDDPTAVVGYRNGDDWYDRLGVPIADPSVLTKGGNINPYLVNGTDEQKNLTTAFEDYTPQVNVMPRISFSFPISDVALFFAHYDILTQRPGGNNIIDPVDYLYLRDVAGSRILNNPDLGSSKTVDYELGFQQVVSRSSSLKIAAFYRQMEDQIQVRSYVQAYPATYRTYDNLDFGTVKGLSLTYDLRRTGNVRMTASYTLQFAEGTGSSSTTALALINAGQPNLKTVNPLSFDRRHRIVLTFDYRYGRGADYNGPMIGSSQILSDFGVNVIGDFATGTPYSDSKRVSSLFEGGGGNRLNGSINGSRLPSTFRVDVQVDKSFPILLGKNEEGGPKMGNLNVYLWFANILNTQNVVNVYRFTGDPQDDGYLASTRGIQDAENRLDPESFTDYYTMAEQNPFNFGIPRTIRLGIRFDF
jgi:hypothetical protein